MVEVGTAAEVSRLSMQMSVLFAVIGVGLLYLAIAISDASNEVKVIWASGLSLTVAFVFLVIWSTVRDSMQSRERELRRKLLP